MKCTIIFLILLSLFIFNLFVTVFATTSSNTISTMNTALLLDSDVGLYRLSNKIIFLSDANILLKNFWIYKCASAGDVDFFKEIFPIVSNLNESVIVSAKEIQQKMNLLDEVLLIFKLQLFLDVNKISSINKSELDELAIKIDKSDCFKNHLNNPTSNIEKMKDFKTLLSLNNFLRSRFNKSSFFVSETELNEYLSTTKTTDSNKAKEAVRSKKVKEAIDLFLSSLNKQITHELIWK
ncbi:MAG: hypothetical protein HQK49_05145 [Oligoflexia bacterium]|nr:hypothetical protein [Oligoflexia bacterium]